MQQHIAALLFLAAASNGAVVSNIANTSPISRVVSMLNHFASKLEVERKTELEMFEKYECWAKNVISTRTASNKQAGDRAAELESYIADIDAGKFEFTSERVDLEQELKTIVGDLEAIAARRASEKADFGVAEKEMTEAIAALEEALSILSAATEGHTANLLSVRSKGFLAREADAAKIARAVDLASRYLSRANAGFLAHVLMGQTPPSHANPDWEKVNKESQWHEKYIARSNEIVKQLGGLLETFTANLKDAREAEEKAASTYKTLTEKKNSEKTATEEALAALKEENGARALTKTEAQEEIDGLKKQIADDKTLIIATEKDLKAKTEVQEQRKTARAEELKAVREAIAILHNDEARDLFTRSYV
eukprot:NODE_6799_length_1638_cov_2.641297.p1 GENE.NODE_6799_length_1638_cov_2.641297~~NODE_6799_length_1638_cov_2.641297.p1  ORF type:complete len:366 (-),score=153.47 NODE_6799_length_1638_cov_2.641297:102-1199(-)